MNKEMELFEKKSMERDIDMIDFNTRQRMINNMSPIDFDLSGFKKKFNIGEIIDDKKERDVIEVSDESFVFTDIFEDEYDQELNYNEELMFYLENK